VSESHPKPRTHSGGGEYQEKLQRVAERFVGSRTLSPWRILEELRKVGLGTADDVTIVTLLIASARSAR
jgi:hypothetical protein